MRTTDQEVDNTKKNAKPEEVKKIRPAYQENTGQEDEEEVEDTQGSVVEEDISLERKDGEEEEVREEGEDSDMETVSRKEKNRLKKEKQNQNKDKNKQTCLHYERSRCRFGVEGTGCSFLHPKMCPKVKRKRAQGAASQRPAPSTTPRYATAPWPAQGCV